MDWKRHSCVLRLFLVMTSLVVLLQVGWFVPNITTTTTTTNSDSRMLRASSSQRQEEEEQPHDGLAGIPLSQVPYATLPYYSPHVLTRQQVSLEEFFAHYDDNNNNHHPETPPEQQQEQQQPILHFVHSRFMQEQGNLTHLGAARLHLFETFCLPTMVAQTTSNFLWLIRMDPDLDAAISARLRQLTAPYPHVYLIASNRNFRINEDFPGAWRDGAQAADLRASRIYTGNPTRLATALALTQDVLILDTRLDADDGLHVDYLRSLQRAARHEFAVRPTLQWKYWCARRHLAWHWAVPAAAHDTAGYVTGTQTSHMCITPGITVAFPVGVAEANVPVYAHHELIPKLQQLPPERRCIENAPDVDCLAFVSTHAFEAIRSRTPTSAGMLAVADAPERPDSAWLEYAFWDVLFDDFGLSRGQLVWMQSYLTNHLRQIGQDNLQGQCTTGVSLSRAWHLFQNSQTFYLTRSVFFSLAFVQGEFGFRVWANYRLVVVTESIILTITLCHSCYFLALGETRLGTFSGVGRSSWYALSMQSRR